MLKCLSIPIKKAVIFHKANFSVIFKKEPETHFWERRKGTWIVLCPSADGARPVLTFQLTFKSAFLCRPRRAQRRGFLPVDGLELPCHSTEKADSQDGEGIG